VSAVALKHCGKYPMHVYEVRPRKDERGVDLISDVLSFGRLWYGDQTQSVTQSFTADSHDAVINVYDEAGKTPFGLLLLGAALGSLGIARRFLKK
jgi:hypothetical protein